MRPLLFATLALSLTLTSACSSDPAPLPAPDGWSAVGTGVSDGELVSFASLMERADELDGSELRLEGEISTVCQNTGCWFTLEQGDDSMRVRFDPYGPVVPMDASGQSVRVEGTFHQKEIPLSEARHYLEDEGRHEEAAALTGPQQGYEFLASGALVKTADA